MKAKITVFLIALAIIFTGGISDAHAAKQEQSWLSKIFSNDEPQMIQKSPFSQPQPRSQPRALNKGLNYRQDDTYNAAEDDRTQTINQGQTNTKNKRNRHAPRNDLSQNYAERIKALRHQRMNPNSLGSSSGSSANSGVNN